MLPRHQKAVFVHGCFWHGHECPRGRRPTSRIDFWNEKLDKNLSRDKENCRLLAEQGWDVLTLWECELADEERGRRILEAFMNEPNGRG